MSLPSMFPGHSPTRAGLTRVLGTGVRPEMANSSTPRGYSPEVRLIFSALSSAAMFLTNSPVARTFARVSVGGSRTPEANETTGGLAHTALKKLKGARLRTPSGETVEKNAIGRGDLDTRK